VSEEQTISETITQDDQSIELQVSSDQDDKWWLQLVDKDGNNTVWEDPFASSDDALAEGRSAIKEEGIATFIGNWES
jgi:hypothetical protein